MLRVARPRPALLRRMRRPPRAVAARGELGDRGAPVRPRGRRAGGRCPVQPAANNRPNAPPPPPPAGPTLPPVKHVFLIVLSDQGYEQAFGASSQAPFLAKTLVKQGELLTNYYAVAGGPLANQI